jgi:amino acid adenylation domain-containing protein/non-ribosomal peptide synthase protein (TIGR01720 family)
MHPKDVEGFQLSLEQRSLWSKSPDINVCCTAVLIEGPLNSDCLRDAWRGVVAGHEILRTTFSRSRGIRFPFQIIAEEDAPPWSEIDLSAEHAQENRIEQLFEQERRRFFESDDWPLRLTLIQLSASKRVLLIGASALCADRRTIGNLIAELGQWYLACLQGAAVSGEPLQYVDYCQWQSELIENEDEQAARGRAFWREQNLAVLHSPQLPWESRSDGHEPASQQSVLLTMNSDVVQRIDSVSARFSTSAAIVLQACWQTLLWRLTDAQAVLSHNVLEGRIHQDLYDACGLFAISVPLHFQFEKRCRFGAIIEQTDRLRRDAEAFRNYIPDELNEAASLPGTSTPVGFEFTELPAPHRIGNLLFSVFKQYSSLERCKLKLSCVRAPETLDAEFHYDPTLYRAEDIEYLARCFEALLTSAIENPDSSLSHLRILSDRDRHLLLFGFNDTAVEYAEDKCVHQLFEEQAAQAPEHLAVASEERQLTYAELNTSANRVAHLLRQRGVGPDVAVGLCIERSAEMIVALLGVLKAGGAYVPLDSDNPTARLSKLVAETRPAVLLTQERFLSHFPDFAGEIICLDRDETILDLQPDTNPGSLAKLEHLAYIIYTSGSTGTPKGAAITHRSLLNYDLFVCRSLLAQPAAPLPRLHFALVSTFTADLGHTSLFPALTSGGTLHIISYEAATDAAVLNAYMAAHPIDVLKITPSHLNALLSAGEGYALLPRRALVIGGEALSYELVKRIRSQASACDVINHYGPTETTVGVLTWRIDKDEEDTGAASVPIGRPIANARAYILDNQMEPVPAGVSGELYIGGAGLARGYLNNSLQTAERFVADPFDLKPGGRLYKTGDMARHLADGRIEFLGRLDHQVKIRGFRVELGEIEAVLKQHAMVRDVVVLVEEEPSGRKRLMAYVVAAKNGSPAVAELRSFLGERLPSYMVPSAVVLLESLPLTANGKVDRAALSSRAGALDAASNDHVAPGNAAEALMSQIWAEVLGLEQVGTRDNFFELGGDSILGIHIIAKANQAGFQLTPKQLFQNQSVIELVGASGFAPGIEAGQGPVSGEVPLTPMQQRFFEQKLSDQHLFSQTVAYEVGPSLDPALIKTVIQQLCIHHDALRLRFVQEETGWKQFHADAEENSVFSYQDLSHLKPAEQKAVFETATVELQSSIDLSKGPLVRIALFRFAASEPDRLLVIGHYLIVDGFSWRILLQDLQDAYQQLSRGVAMRLPPKTTSFQSWSERMVRAAGSEEIKSELQYWLAGPGAQKIGRLPLDRPEGLNLESSVGTVSVSLSAEETTALLREVPAAYHSEITDALLTALMRAVSHWTGERYLFVDLESHGRSDTLLGEDLSRTVGRMTYRAPAWLEMNGTQEPGNALKSVKEQLRRFREVSVSYGLLRYQSADADTVKKMSALPASDLYFNYVGQLDSFLSSSSLSIKATPQLLTAVRGTDNQRPYLIDISAMIMEGRLQCIWEFSTNTHLRATIASLAQDFISELRALITHCQSPKAGGYTPSDFPAMGFDQQELDDLIAKISTPAHFNEQERN